MVGYAGETPVGWPRSRAGRPNQGTHGARSEICSLVEKYVWTGCYHIQAYLAGRIPAEVITADGADRWVEPPIDPLFVSDLLPNPASETRERGSGKGVSWSFRPDDDLAPRGDIKAHIQVDMADEWIRGPPKLGIRSWLSWPMNARFSSPMDEDWIVLSCKVTKIEPFSQAESHLSISSFVVPAFTVDELRCGGDRLTPSRRRSLSALCEGVRCHIYVDAFDAAWSPWATSAGEVDGLDVRGPMPIALQPTVAGLTCQDAMGEDFMNLPAHWLRIALGFTGAERRFAPGGEECGFVDRQGEVHAVFTRTRTARNRREALLIKRSSLCRALAGQEKRLVWAAWLCRCPTSSLYSDAREKVTHFEERHAEWLAFLSSDGADEEVIELP